MPFSFLSFLISGKRAQKGEAPGNAEKTALSQFQTLCEVMSFITDKRKGTHTL